MCGICGIFEYGTGAPAPRDLVSAMTESLRHRGPDDDGSLFDGPLGFGFRRLSIIDLSTGHQPLANEDETCWVMLNGEIYNYRELRRELQGAGHRFRTQSDTETLVHGYEAWGDDVTSHLNGIFGLALWDAPRRRLLLARDHLGVKPLYYYDDGERLRFASEIKAILQDGRVPREVDPESLALFLAYGYVPSPRTLFKGIRKLPPGWRLVCDAQGVRPERHWRAVPLLRARISARDAEEEYARLLQSAVQRQMVSDVPVGSMLSGGVDSGLVTALMREASAQPVMTFSVGFEDEGDWNELDDAARTARELGTDHHPLRIDGRHFGDFFAESLWHLEEPVLSSSTFAFYHLSKLAQQHVKVVLTGQGADELWAGYERYRGERLAGSLGRLAGSLPARRLVALLPRSEPLRRASAALGERDPVERFAAIHTLFTRADTAALLRPEMARVLAGYDTRAPFRVLQTEVAHLDGVSQLLYCDARLLLPDDYLMYGDKMSMANSLEARVPLLDRELVEFVESLPVSLKMRGLTGKYLHKRTAARWLSPEIVGRRKKGFATPIDAWFQRSQEGFVRDTLQGADSACSRYFVPGFIARLLDEHRTRRRDHRRRIFALLSFELWHRRFLQSSVALPMARSATAKEVT